MKRMTVCVDESRFGTAAYVIGGAAAVIAVARRHLYGAGLALVLAAAPSAWALELNTATRAELEQLHGIGVYTADLILAERAKRPFRDWEDLLARVKGLRGARSARLQALGVTVNGYSTPRPPHPSSRIQ